MEFSLTKAVFSTGSWLSSPGNSIQTQLWGLPPVRSALEVSHGFTGVVGEGVAKWPDLAQVLFLGYLGFPSGDSCPVRVQEPCQPYKRLRNTERNSKVLSIQART